MALASPRAAALMAQHVSYSCDRCGPEAPAALHLELEVGVEVVGRENGIEDEKVEMQTVDLCLACGARALKFTSEGMGHAAKRAWIAMLLAKEAPANG